MTALPNLPPPNQVAGEAPAAPAPQQSRPQSPPPEPTPIIRDPAQRDAIAQQVAQSVVRKSSQPPVQPAAAAPAESGEARAEPQQPADAGATDSGESLGSSVEGESQRQSTEPDGVEYTPDSFAAALGAEPAEFYAEFHVPVEVNGQQQTVSLGQLKDAYTNRNQQMAGEAQALAAERAQHTQHAQAQLAQLRQQSEHLAVLSNQIDAVMMAEFQGMEQLRVSDPEAYNQQLVQKMQREQQLNGIKQQLSQQQHAIAQQHQQATQQSMQTFLEARRTEVLKRVPEWSDNNVMRTELTRIEADLTAQGVPTDQQAMLPAWGIAYIRDALKYREMKSTASAKPKRIIPKEKFVSPKNQHPQGDPTVTRNVNNLRQAVKTRSREDIGRAFAHLARRGQ